MWTAAEPAPVAADTTKGNTASGQYNSASFFKRSTVDAPSPSTGADSASNGAANPLKAVDNNALALPDSAPIMSFSLAGPGGQADPQATVPTGPQLNAAPEPSTWACLAMAGGVGVWLLRRRAHRTV